MSRKLVIAIAAAVLVLIVFATLSPMAWRPVLVSHMESENVAVVERLLAYAVMGFLIAVLLPKRALLPYVLIMLLAVGLEVLQEFRPDRHALIGDGLQKAAGGVIGVFFAKLVAARVFGTRRRSK